MPLKIALCDDNKEQIRALRRMLAEWAAGKPIALETDEYSSAESFLFSYPDKPCSLLLLDIEMKEINGMELAKKLRQSGDDIPIVFITGFSDYMNEGYEVEALHYLLKPVDKDKLFRVLDRYLQKRPPENELVVSCGGEMLHISPHMITCCEAMGKRTLLYLSDGRVTECSSGISAVKEMLPPEFIFCHRSYIVNLRRVRSIGRDTLTTDRGENIPVSRRLLKEINGKFIEFYKGGEL